MKTSIFSIMAYFLGIIAAVLAVEEPGRPAEPAASEPARLRGAIESVSPPPSPPESARVCSARRPLTSTVVSFSTIPLFVLVQVNERAGLLLADAPSDKDVALGGEEGRCVPAGNSCWSNGSPNPNCCSGMQCQAGWGIACPSVRSHACCFFFPAVDFNTHVLYSVSHFMLLIFHVRDIAWTVRKTGTIG